MNETLTCGEHRSSNNAAVEFTKLATIMPQPNNLTSKSRSNYIPLIQSPSKLLFANINPVCRISEYSHRLFSGETGDNDKCNAASSLVMNLMVAGLFFCAAALLAMKSVSPKSNAADELIWRVWDLRICAFGEPVQLSSCGRSKLASPSGDVNLGNT